MGGTTGCARRKTGCAQEWPRVEGDRSGEGKRRAGPGGGRAPQGGGFAQCDMGSVPADVGRNVRYSLGPLVVANDTASDASRRYQLSWVTGAIPVPALEALAS